MTERRKWREVKGRPVQGNSPNDRILHGPDCHRYKRVCADPFPATPSPSPKNRPPIGVRFLGMTESIAPIWSLNPINPGLYATFRSAVSPGKGRDGRSAPCSSFAMSSGRLILDRVGRHQSPSPLHRHTQINMHFSAIGLRGDISTLPEWGHFYFALTPAPVGLTNHGRLRYHPANLEMPVPAVPGMVSMLWRYRLHIAGGNDGTDQREDLCPDGFVPCNGGVPVSFACQRAGQRYGSIARHRDGFERRCDSGRHRDHDQRCHRRFGKAAIGSRQGATCSQT